MIETHSQRDPLDQLAESFLARYRAGEVPPLTEYTDKYPEFAEEIRELFPALVVMEKARPKGVERGEPGASATGDGTEIPSQLGDYRLIREIGRGGMGVVFEAVQESLHRHVALKVLPYHSWVKPTHLERFRREAQAAARLHHTNIVPVFGVGEHEGIHYYAMQFIHGQGLEAVLNEVKRLRGQTATTHSGNGGLGQSLAFSVAEGLLTGRFSHEQTSPPAPPRSGEGSQTPPSLAGKGAGGLGDRGSSTPPPGSHSELSGQTEHKYFRSVAEIGVQVAGALAYAHGQGVLHRDIKPSNLLLDTAGRIWITDFGLAKTEDSKELTNPGDMVGTLRYMSPERCQGRADARSDVYGLGITLYEMLTLRPAFGDSNRQQLIREITDRDPPWPHKLDRKIPRDLETVVLKAIAKEPGKRYATAEKMAEDLRLFLADRPIQARRSSAAEQLWRWCRRNQAVATWAALALTLLLAVAIISTLAAVWTSKEQTKTLEQLQLTQIAEGLATEAKDEATRRLFHSLVEEARGNRYSRRMGQRFKSLLILAEAAKMARDLGLPEENFLELRNEVIACLALPDLRVAKEWAGWPPGGLPNDLYGKYDFDAKLERYARVDNQGKVSIRRVANDEEIFPVPAEQGQNSVRFSPQGQFLAVINPQQFKVWKLADQQPVLVTLGVAASGNDPFAFRPDDRQLAVGHPDGSIDVYDLNTAHRLQHLKGGARPWHLAFHPSQPQLAVACQGSVQVRDLAGGRVLAQFQIGQPNDPAWPWVAWHPKGKVLAAVGESSNIYLWDVPTKKQIGKLEGCRNQGISLTFNHAGDVLASTGWEGLVRLWDHRLGKELFSTQAWTLALHFSPDDRLLAAEVIGNKLRTWEVATGRVYRTLVRDPGLGKSAYFTAAVDSDGRLLAVGSHDGFGLWDLNSNQELAFIRLPGINHVLFEPSGSLLTNGQVGLWRWPVKFDAASPGLVRVGPPQKLPLSGTPNQIASSPDGRVLASAQGWGAYVVDPDRAPVALQPHEQVRYVAVSPDRRWVATGSHGASPLVKVWEASSGMLEKELAAGSRGLVAFSPNGKWLATVGDGVRLWATDSWEQRVRFENRSLVGLAFSPDSRMLAFETGYGAIRLIDPESSWEKEWARLEDPDQHRAGFIYFSPDGTQLVKTGSDRIAVWNLRAIRPQLAARGLDWKLPDYPPPKENDSPSTPPRVIVDRTLPVQQDPQLYEQQLRKNIEEWTNAIKTEPRAVDSYVSRAFAYFQLGEFIQDKADLEKALELDANNAQACNNLAWIYIKGPAAMRDSEKGLALAQRAVRLKPDSRHLQNNLGVAYYRLKQWDGAIVALEQAVRVNKDEATAFELFFMAMSYHKLGDKDQARESYDRALEWIKSNELSLLPHQLRELKIYRSEAEAVLGMVPAKSEAK